jgi:hypothetical protein
MARAIAVVIVAIIALVGLRQRIRQRSLPSKGHAPEQESRNFGALRHDLVMCIMRHRVQYWLSTLTPSIWCRAVK